MNDISVISEDYFDNNYKGEIFYQDINRLTQNVAKKDLNSKDVLLAKCFYKEDNQIKTNYIYGNSYTTSGQLQRLINEAKRWNWFITFI